MYKDEFDLKNQTLRNIQSILITNVLNNHFSIAGHRSLENSPRRRGDQNARRRPESQGVCAAS